MYSNLKYNIINYTLYSDDKLYKIRVNKTFRSKYGQLEIILCSIVTLKYREKLIFMLLALMLETICLSNLIIIILSNHISWTSYNLLLIFKFLIELEML